MRTRKQSSISPKNSRMRQYNRSPLRSPIQLNHSQVTQNNYWKNAEEQNLHKQDQFSRIVKLQKTLLCYNSLFNTNKHMSLFINTKDYAQSEAILNENKTKNDTNSKRIVQRVNKYLTTVWKVQSAFNVQIPQLADSRSKINKEIQHIGKSNCLKFSITLNQCVDGQGESATDQVKESIINKLRQQQFDQVLENSHERDLLNDKQYTSITNSNQKQLLRGTRVSVKMTQTIRQQDNYSNGPTVFDCRDVSGHQQPICKIKIHQVNKKQKSTYNQKHKEDLLCQKSNNNIKQSERQIKNNKNSIQSQFKKITVYKPNRTTQNHVNSRKKSRLGTSKDILFNMNQKSFENPKSHINQINGPQSSRVNRIKKLSKGKKDTFCGSSFCSMQCDNESSRKKHTDSVINERNHFKSQFQENLIWVTINRTQQFMQLMNSLDQ